MVVVGNEIKKMTSQIGSSLEEISYEIEEAIQEKDQIKEEVEGEIYRRTRNAKRKNETL